MYNHSNVITFIFLLPILISCSCYLFPEFKVIEYNYTDTKISITFSDIPDFDKARNSFIFSEDERHINGYFEISDKTLTFYPAVKITDNHNYKVTISNSVETKTGVSLENDFIWNFSTKKINKPLELISISKTEPGIELSFSSPVNEKLLLNSISISPSLPYICTWNDEKTVITIKFLESEKINTRYFLTVSDSLCDVYNNSLHKSINYTFINEQTDNTLHFYTSDNTDIKPLSPENLNTGIPLSSSFECEFEKPIGIEQFRSGLSIEPPEAFHISQDDFNPRLFHLSLTKKPEYNSKYKFIFDIAINNEKKINETYEVIFNNFSDIKPEFICGFLTDSTQTTFLLPNKPIYNLLLPVDVYPTIDSLNSPDIIFYLVFSHAPESQILLSSAIDNINFSTTNNCIDILPYDMTLLTTDEIKNLSFTSDLEKIQIQDNSISVLKISSHIQNHVNPGLIKLKISSQITDTKLNELSGEIIFTFNKQ